MKFTGGSIVVALGLMVSSVSNAAPIVYHFTATGNDLNGIVLDTATNRLAGIDRIKGKFTFDPSDLIDDIIADIQARTGSGETGGLEAAGTATLLIDEVPGLANPEQELFLGYSYAFETGGFSFSIPAFGGLTLDSGGSAAPGVGEVTASFEIERTSIPTASIGASEPLSGAAIAQAVIEDLRTIDLTDANTSISVSLATNDGTDEFSRGFTVDTFITPVPLPAAFSMLLLGVLTLPVLRRFRVTKPA